MVGSGPRIAVIGAGPCGLTAAKVLVDAGLTNLTVFEKGTQVGGNWVYTTGEGHSSVFETTHIISSKRLSQYSDFPMPPDYPDYPSRRQLLDYFEAYAKQFDLHRLIRFGALVERASLLPDTGWRLEVSGVVTERFDFVLVANGHHWDPRWPNYPGSFSGRLLHSHDFKTNEPFRGQRVLVIGGGNSACDIAVETGRVAARTGLSWRRGYYIVPKVMFGLPADVINARMQWLPSPLRRILLDLSWRVVTGGNKAYGLPEPDHPILASHPVVNSELLYGLKHGRVHPYPDLARFDGSLVHFTDGRAEPFDVVIAATGFRIGFPFLDRALIDFSDGDVPLYLRVFHPEIPTIFFIGLVQPAGCIWPLAEAQARLVARRILGRFALPGDVTRRVAEDLRRIRGRYVASPRHSIEVDYHEHLAQLEAALGAEA